MRVFPVVLGTVTAASVLGLVALQRGWLTSAPKAPLLPPPKPAPTLSPRPLPKPMGLLTIPPGGTVPPGGLVALTTSRVNLREAPDTSAPIKALLSEGARVAQRESVEPKPGEPAWWKVITSTGLEGFVRTDNLRLETQSSVAKETDMAGWEPWWGWQYPRRYYSRTPQRYNAYGRS